MEDTFRGTEAIFEFHAKSRDNKLFIVNFRVLGFQFSTLHILYFVHFCSHHTKFQLEGYMRSSYPIVTNAENDNDDSTPGLNYSPRKYSVADKNQSKRVVKVDNFQGI